jgi:hypothetical protein
MDAPTIARFHRSFPYLRSLALYRPCPHVRRRRLSCRHPSPCPRSRPRDLGDHDSSADQVCGSFLAFGLGALAYVSVNLGEKSDLFLLVGRRAAFFLSFFNFLVGFFSTLDFLVFLAILDFLRLQSRHRGLRCARVKVPNFKTETLGCPKN